jgi:hypothetical protein
MVELIENQMHRYLIKREEEKCREIEEKMKNGRDGVTKKVKRKKVAKPWTRSGPKALCMEPDLLLMVDEYDYDLANKDFQEYCLNRGILGFAGDIGSKRWSFFLDFCKSKAEYLNDPYFQFAQEMNGKRHKYTDNEMEGGWKIIKLGRAKLQDCWELYAVQ